MRCAGDGRTGGAWTPLHSKARTTPPNRASAERPQSPPTYWRLGGDNAKRPSTGWSIWSGSTGGGNQGSQGGSQSGLNNPQQHGPGWRTGSAFVVGTSTNAGAQFLGAMNAIRQANDVACTIPMPQPPSGELIDYTKVSVTYSTGGGAPTALTWNASSACGASGGFYYDRDTNPSTILLCPTTCTTVQADATAKLRTPSWMHAAKHRQPAIHGRRALDAAHRRRVSLLARRAVLLKWSGLLLGELQRPGLLRSGHQVASSAARASRLGLGRRCPWVGASRESPPSVAAEAVHLPSTGSADWRAGERLTLNQARRPP